MKTGNTLLATMFSLVLLPAGAAGQGQEADRSLTSSVAGEPAITLNLDEVLGLAMSGNRDLERARLGLELAEGQVAEAWSSVYPRIDLSTSYTRNLTPSVSFIPAIFFNPDAAEGELLQVQFGAENVWTNSIALEQPLFRASAFIGVGAAGRFQSLQEETVRGSRHEVLTGVRILYYQLLLAQEQVDLTARSIVRVEESLEETRALNRAGLSSDYDVLRLEVELANLEPEFRRSENEVLRLRRNLATQLGLEPGTVVEVSGSLAALDLETPSANTPENARMLALVGVELAEGGIETQLEDLLRRADAGNSQLQQAGLGRELRNTELQLERAEYLPEVTLFASYDIQAQQDGRPDFFGSSQQRGYGRNVGVRVSLPIFEGFQRRARIDQMQASLRTAQVELDLAREQVGNELRTVLEQTEEARLRTRGQRLAVEQAERGFEIASAQYREGIGSQLELTDAEVALRQSEFNYAQAVFDYLSGRARVDQIVGEIPVPGEEG